MKVCACTAQLSLNTYLVSGLCASCFSFFREILYHCRCCRCCICCHRHFSVVGCRSAPIVTAIVRTGRCRVEESDRHPTGSANGRLVDEDDAMATARLEDRLAFRPKGRENNNRSSLQQRKPRAGSERRIEVSDIVHPDHEEKCFWFCSVLSECTQIIGMSFAFAPFPPDS